MEPVAGHPLEHAPQVIQALKSPWGINALTLSLIPSLLCEIFN
jgi:hypothetical protein